MLNFKRFIVIGVLFAAVSAMVMGQQRQGMTVEETYLRETIELQIIRDTSRADSREMKMVALEYISDFIERGGRNDEIRTTLEFLGLEGIRNQVREEGRLLNNFPDVRARAATYLGQLGTPEAKSSLIRMTLDETEPMVITEAIRSLGIIGINENDETINAISWVFSRFDNLKPDNLLALSTLDAFERLAAANNGALNAGAIQTILRIIDGLYIRPVQDRARELLRDLRGGL